MRSGIYGIIIIATVILCDPVMAYDWSTNPGDGSQGNPYQISTPEQLISIGSNVDLLDKHYVLMNDIFFDPNNNPAHVFETALIAPDQDVAQRFYQGTPFSGSLDGQNHQIVNLRIIPTVLKRPYLGLFGMLDSHAVISNLQMQHFLIQDGSAVGSIAGRNDGIIQNCSSQGEIHAIFSVSDYGGLVGFNRGILRNCTSETTILGVERSAAYGGLAGSNSGLIEDCYARLNIHFVYTGNINVGVGDVGGLTGYNSGEIRNSTAIAEVENYEVAMIDNIGGLVGLNQSLSGNIIRCQARLTYSVSKGSNDIGGLIGKSGGEVFQSDGNFHVCLGKIIDCSSELTVEGADSIGGLIGGNLSSDVIRCSSKITVIDTGSNVCGGLIGFHMDSYNEQIAIEDCYATGILSGYQFAGGLIGQLSGSQIKNSYSTCLVQPGVYDVGAFIGAAVNDPSIDHCYFLNTAGPDNGYGMPLTDVQMKQRASFIGWDFVGESVNGENEIWRMCVDGVDYPRLSSEFARGGDYACGDGVDLADLQVLADAWLTLTETDAMTFNFAADANGDEQIDLQDFGALSENWFR